MFRANAETPNDRSPSLLPAAVVNASPGAKSRRKCGSVGARHEVRAWLSRDTYDRLGREASARHGTLSQSVRECLDEYFVLKQEIASALTPTPDEGATPGEGMRLAHALLDENARRIVAEIARRDARLEALLDKIGLVGCMVDRAYLSLVARLPDVEPSLRAARLAAAEEGTRRWRQVVREMHRAGGQEDVQ